MIYMQNFYAAVYCYRNEALKALRGRVLGEGCPPPQPTRGSGPRPPTHSRHVSRPQKPSIMTSEPEISTSYQKTLEVGTRRITTYTPNILLLLWRDCNMICSQTSLRHITRDLRSFVIRFEFESYVRFEIWFVLMVRFEIFESSGLSIVIRKETIGGG